MNIFTKPIIHLRLGTKSIFAVVILLSTISIILSWFFISRQKDFLTEELRKRAFSLSSNLAFNSQFAVLSGDSETLKNLVSGVIKESDIRQAIITDMDGTIIAEQIMTRAGLKVDFADELDSTVTQKWIVTKDKNICRTINLIEIERISSDRDEILLPNDYGAGSKERQNLLTQKVIRENVGYAILEVSLESMNHAVASATRQAILITLVMIIAGSIAATLLVRTIAMPIYRMVNATRAVASDMFDHRVPVDRSDEIGVLASAFNDMTAKLERSRDKIEAWNRELERKVTERTAELEAKHEELEKAYDALKSLDNAKDEFLSLVSHELRTPLSAILLYSEMLRDGMVDEEQHYEFLTNIVDNCYRLTRLINDVLDLSKIEAGRMTFNMEVLDFNTIVNDTLAGIKPNIDNKKIDFRYDREINNRKIWADRDKIIQVLTNIISNAVKFTPNNGIISVSLALDNEKMLRVEIADTGKGISREDIPKVFDRFKQLESIDQHSSGTGLGMTISKSIIERLGGRIWIESEPDMGTSVFFTLQAARGIPETNLSQTPEFNDKG